MPLLCLLLVLVLEYVRPDDLFPFIRTLNLYAIIPLVVVAIAWVSASRHKNGEIFGSAIGKILVGIFIAVTVATIAAMYRDRAWDFWQATLGYLLLFFMLAKICDDQDKVRWVFRVLVGVHVWLVLQNPALLTDPTQRSYIEGVTFLGDGNDFSLSTVIVLPMCLYLFQTSRSNLGRVTCVAAAIVLFGAIMGTQSRGGALGVIAVVFFLWSLAQKKGAGMVLIVAGLIVVLAVASDQYLSRIQTIAAPRDASAQSRLDAWAAGIGMANRRPLTGIGPGGFPIAFGNWYAHPGLPRMNAHSMYFQALGDVGYPAFFMLIWLMWIMFRDNQRLIRRPPPTDNPRSDQDRKLLIAITASLVGFGVSGAFLSAFYYPHLYVVAGLLYASRRIFQSDYGGVVTEEERSQAEGSIRQGGRRRRRPLRR